MSSISDEIIEAIKVVASLKSMGDDEASLILGKKIIESFYDDKDGVIFQCAYNKKELNYKDVNSLVNAAFLYQCCKLVYKSFKEFVAGSKAEFWFKKGTNNADLHRFFNFLARVDKRIDVESDLKILYAAKNALENNATYTIPSSLSRYSLNDFIKGISTGEIRVSGEGLR